MFVCRTQRTRKGDRPSPLSFTTVSCAVNAVSITGDMPQASRHSPLPRLARVPGHSPARPRHAGICRRHASQLARVRCQGRSRRDSSSRRDRSLRRLCGVARGRRSRCKNPRADRSIRNLRPSKSMLSKLYDDVHATGCAPSTSAPPIHPRWRWRWRPMRWPSSPDGLCPNPYFKSPGWANSDRTLWGRARRLDGCQHP
jgi:hypothetical protein